MWRWLPAALLAAGPAFALDAKSESWNCPELKLLPADATDEDRRITCEIPGEFRRQVTEAEREGRRLRAHDAAAWTSTDALHEIGAFDDPPGEGDGWLTRETDGAIEVTYFATVAGEPRGYAEARFDLGTFKIVSARRLAQPRPADERELRLLRARETALAADRLQCSRKLNTVTLEDEGTGEISVYVFSAWEDPGLMPMGGHSRFRITPDGARIIETLQQTKSCNTTLDAEKAKVEKFGFITDLVDESPSGMQVFLEIQYHVPITIVTAASGRVWSLDEGRIHALRPDDERVKAVLDYFKKLEAEDAKDTAPAVKSD